VSACLFLLVVACFVLPFASTSCTLPGGYGRGGPGTSTVYRGVDLAFDTVPEVTPPDRPARTGYGPDDGRLGVQPLALFALAAALAGIVVSLLPIRRRVALTTTWAAATLVLLVADQAVLTGEITDRIQHEMAQPLPAGKQPIDYVGNGLGFQLGLLLLVLVVTVNLVTSGIAHLRRRAPAPRASG